MDVDKIREYVERRMLNQDLTENPKEIIENTAQNECFDVVSGSKADTLHEYQERVKSGNLTQEEKEDRDMLTEVIKHFDENPTEFYENIVKMEEEPWRRFDFETQEEYEKYYKHVLEDLFTKDDFRFVVRYKCESLFFQVLAILYRAQVAGHKSFTRARFLPYINKDERKYIDMILQVAVRSKLMVETCITGKMYYSLSSDFHFDDLYHRIIGLEEMYTAIAKLREVFGKSSRKIREAMDKSKKITK